MNKIILIVMSVVFLGGCNSVQVDDGVLRNEQGEALIGNANQSIKVSDYLQELIYDGQSYISSINIDLQPGENYTLVGSTDGRLVLMDFRQVVVTDLQNQEIDIEVNLWEDVNVINNGSNLNIFNLNRNIAEDNTFLIYENSTLDLTSALFIPALSNRINTNTKRAVSTSTQDNMYIMREDTDYGLIVENKGLGDVNVRFRWSWEELNK